MNDRLNDKKALWKTILIVIAAFAMFKLIGLFFGDLSDKLVTNKLFNECLWQIIMLVCALIAAFFTKRLGVLKLTGIGFKAGIIAGMYLLLEGAARFILWVAELVTGMTSVSVPAINIIVFILFCLLIGISEELLSRGVLLEGFLDYFGNGSVEALRKAIIFSGIIFGALHLANLTSSTNPLGTVLSSIANMATGMIYCAAYVRGKRNIWPCVLIHALKDASLYLMVDKILTKEYYLPNAVSAESAGITSVTAGIIAAAIYFSFAVLAMRKEALLPFVNAQNESSEA